MVLAPDPQPSLRPNVPRSARGAEWQVPAGHARRWSRPAARRAQAGDSSLGEDAADVAPGTPSGGTGEQIRVAEGVELMGESEGSGYIDRHYLARTGSGRVVQLTRLLFLVAEAAGPEGATDEVVAQRVTEAHGKPVTADNVRTLAAKMRPLGILAEADGTDPDVVEPDPLLALKLRSTLLGPRGVQKLTLLFRPLFFGPIVLAALVGLVALDLWIFLDHGLAEGLRATLGEPSLFLLAFGLVVLSAAFHECGHATACVVGGGRPGRMGAGVFLAWPAFYTDVTDAYRLGRKARLRTDLGGVYFSCLLVLGLGGAYFLTGFEPLLLIAFLMQIEVVHQLLPFLRLDGYYVVSDLVGVPDLFKRTGPVLKSMLPGHKPADSVLELKRWVRNVVRAWVLIVVPILLLNIGMILLSIPRILATAWDSAAMLIGTLQQGGAVLIAISVIQLIFLVIPIAGLGWTFSRIGARLMGSGWRWSEGSAPRRGLVLAGAAGALALLALAWFPDARLTPYRPGESGTLQAQAGGLRFAGQGSPLLRTPTEARQPLPPLPGDLAGQWQPRTAGSPGPGRPTPQTSPQPSATPSGRATATASPQTSAPPTGAPVTAQATSGTSGGSGGTAPTAGATSSPGATASPSATSAPTSRSASTSTPTASAPSPSAAATASAASSFGATPSPAPSASSDTSGTTTDTSVAPSPTSSP